MPKFSAKAPRENPQWLTAKLNELTPKGIHRAQFAMHLLTEAENERWFDLIDVAAQTPVGDRTERQKMILRAWRHFQLAEYIDLTAPETQGGVYLLWAEGVFGPVFDGEGEATPEEQAAIDRHNRVAAGLPPE